MHIKISNFRGIAHAEFDISSIALIAGDNHTGKTSVAMAVASALTRNVAPIPGMLKGDTGHLLKQGEQKGSVDIITEPGHMVRVVWPSGKITDDDNSPVASPIACGLESIAGMKPKDMATTLGRLLDLNPTLDQLKAALPGIEPGRLTAIWRVVEAEGWDAAQHRAKEHATKAKGAWEHVTQDHYGPDKASKWQAPNLGDWDENALVDMCQARRERLQELQRSRSLNIDQLTQQKTAGEQAVIELRALEGVQNRQSAAVGKIRMDYRALPQVEQREEMPACPSCGTLLVVEAHDKLRLPTKGISDEENQRRRTAIEAKRIELVNAESELDESDNRVRALQAVIRLGQAAVKTISQSAQNPASDAEVEQAEADLQAAQAQLVACQAQAQADAYHDTAAMMTRIADQLAPTGVRQGVLLEKLGAFNELLRTLTEVAGWEAVQVHDDLSLWCGRCPYWLASKSEQFQAGVVLQLALSEGVVIIDGADILGRNGRNQLMKLLHTLDRPALVCMTLGARVDMPDLAAAGYGSSHWIESEVLQ